MFVIWFVLFVTSVKVTSLTPYSCEATMMKTGKVGGGAMASWLIITRPEYKLALVPLMIRQW